MSYILDALRKADAQRARDPARGIHAQPAIAVPVTPAARGRWSGWAGGAAALAIVAVAAWMGLGADPPVAPPVAAIAPAPRLVVVPAPPADVVLPPAPPPVVAAPPPPVAVAARAPVAAAPASAPPTAAAMPASAPTPVAAADRTYSLADLPADVRQALPKFTVSGGVYSENVAQRMLVVNGQVFNEGSEIATGVVLEQIRARTALLKFRGLRIAQPF